jgi:hypothetical protein
MRMRLEPGVGVDDIVVAHEQQAMMRVLRVVMLAEAKAVIGFKPIDRGIEAVGRSFDVDQTFGFHTVLLFARFS